MNIIKLMMMFVIPLTLFADSIGNALDCSSNSWTSGGASNWYAQNSTTHDGSDAVQSGAISHNQTSWMETAVNGPANISFWWKVSSESGYDYLKFYIDGDEQNSISGETSWAQKTYTLTSGSHTLKWVYSKDGSVNNGSDCGWVDQVVVTTQPDEPSQNVRVWYVNGSTGSDSNSGLSANLAKATIQSAIDAAAAGDTILVAPGTYAPIVTANKLLRIESIQGPLVTKINGDGRICADFGGENRHFSTNTAFVGFTCYNGGVPGEGSGVCCGTAERCIIRDCNGSGCGWAIVKDCLIANNHGINGGGVIGCLAINCIIIGNTAAHSGSGSYNSALRNCIVYGNSGGYDNNGDGVFNGTEASEELWIQLGYIGNKDGVYIGDPGFVDAANGDYRLAAGSPCIDAGDNSYVTTTTDLAGNVRIVNGMVDIGCYEYGASPLSTTITNGLVAWYKLDGNANDSSGNGYDLVTRNDPQLTTDRFGNVDSAYVFDGDDSQIITDVDVDNMMEAVESTFTFSLWFQTDASYTDYGAGWAWNKGNYAFFPINGDVADPNSHRTKVGIGVKVGCDGIEIVEHTAFYMPTALNYEANIGTEWNHVTVTVTDSDTYILYLNGRQVAEGKSTGRTCIVRPCGIGGGDWGFYTGKIDDVRIYNRALSAEEVQALYSGTTAATGVWTVTQYNFKNRVSSIDDAIRRMSDSSFWARDPSVCLTDVIAFEDGNTLSSRYHMESRRFPGNPDGSVNYDYGTKTIGRIRIPQAGTYTFCVGSDDGFRCWIKGNGINTSFEYSGLRNLGMNCKTIVFEQPGEYDVELWHFSYDGGILFFAVANGVFESYDTSIFKLVGDPASGVTTVGGSTTLSPIIEHTITLDANGGNCATNSITRDHGASYGTLPTPTRVGYTFTGWFTSASGGTQVTTATTATSNATIYAQWQINSYTIALNANGGNCSSGSITRNHGASYGTLPTPTRAGYTFTGWFTSASGGTQVTTASTATANTTIYAQWRQLSFQITFDANGGEGGDVRTYNYGVQIGNYPVPSMSGYEFLGWFTSPVGGTQISQGMTVTANATYYAQWELLGLYNPPAWSEDGEVDWSDAEEDPFAAEAAATFDGYIFDSGEVVGFVNVKAAKKNKRSGISKIKASVTLIGTTKKLSYKGDMLPNGYVLLTCSKQPDMTLVLGTNAMWGELNGMEISGARNVFAKPTAEVSDILSRFKGVYSIALETVDAEGEGAYMAYGYSVLSVEIGAKGKVKVKGTLVDGSKVSASSQLLVGETGCCIPIVSQLYSKKGGFGFNMWLYDDGSFEVSDISAWNALGSRTPFVAWWGEEVAVAKAGGALPKELWFVSDIDFSVDGVELLYDYLPYEVMIETSSKWKLPKADKLVWNNNEEWFLPKNDNWENVSGLKLTYAKKTGGFKGSFYVYCVTESLKLKKYTANVSGAMVGNVGYGTATIKGIGNWPIIIFK